MIMIENKSTGKVLVLDRKISSWAGLTFPGGHVEWGESFYDAAVREAKEETGLDVKNLTLCGVVNWANKRGGDRYLEFLYKTNDFYGVLSEGTIEGNVLWMTPEELKSSDRLSPNFDMYLPIFFGGKYKELYFRWDGKSWTAEPNYF
jgi:8-oxo-dGTP diphosphatase